MALTLETDRRTANPSKYVQELVTELAVGQPGRLIELVDRLLDPAGPVTELRAEFHSPDCWRVRVSGGPPTDIPVHADNGRFRAVLARIAVLCHETTGADFQVYGGEADLVRDGVRWHARWHNSMSRQALNLSRADWHGSASDV